MTDLPTPKQMATAIAKSQSYSKDEKRHILKAIKYLGRDDIVRLYEALLHLHKVEEEYIQKVEAVDERYKMQFKHTLDQLKEGGFTPPPDKA